MPYIKQIDREKFRPTQEELPSIDTAGELNYLISSIIMEYTRIKGISYQTINDVVGVMEGAKLEFYRRVVVPYENKKIEENGDL